MSQMRSKSNKEFQGSDKLTSMDRREFMKYLGMFSSMSFLANCTRPADNILPFTKEISEFSRRNYEYYSTAISERGLAQGILVKSFQGRPIKIEGNPQHPLSLGATTPQAQVSLYDLYHPDRLQGLVWKGNKKKFSDLSSLIKEETDTWGTGEGIYFLFSADHSPSQVKLIKDIQKKFPSLQCLTLSPWKKTTWSMNDLSNKEVVITFDEDIFYGRPDSLKLSREFMTKRKNGMKTNNPEKLNFLFALSSSPQLVTAKADRKKILRREDIWNSAVDLLEHLKGKPSNSKIVQEIALKLKNKSGVVFIGETLHPDSLILQREINEKLKADENWYSYPLPETTNQENFEKDLKNGKIKTLVMMDTNLLHWRPDLRSSLKKIPHKISYSLWDTETTAVSDTTIARSHFLESWGDLISIDGAVSIQQPLIKPIFHSVDPIAFLTQFTRQSISSYSLIKETYKENFETGLLNGILQKNIFATTFETPETKFIKLPPDNSYRVKIIPDYSIGYGENAKNPLLQELPKIYSREVWQNAYLMNEEDAKILGLKNKDVIEVKSKSSVSKGPILIVPYVAPKTLIATLGYGEDKRGTNNFVFKDGETISIRKISKRQKLALWQDDLSAEGRNPIQYATLPLSPAPEKKIPSLYPDHPLKHQEEGPQWGMTIDLTTCIGCQSCVLACQVENNVPFVGEVEAAKGRMMHWLRVDTYHVNNETSFQPIPCMHCEKAPCEVVCPVNATLHGNGGLNEMVYNRCVGTRYCSNNCPYRVRRFNFKAYSVLKEPFAMGFNPEVSVRDRGVMEKCTYCIQRIREGEVTGDTSKVVSACAQVCPTEAIKFGDLKNPQLDVSKEKKDLRIYDLLEEEGTRPRTSYLKVIRI